LPSIEELQIRLAAMPNGWINRVANFTKLLVFRFDLKEDYTPHFADATLAQMRDEVPRLHVSGSYFGEELFQGNHQPSPTSVPCELRQAKLDITSYDGQALRLHCERVCQINNIFIF